MSLTQVINNKVLSRWLIFGAAVALFLLRLFNLGAHEFWYDEICTIGEAQYPWSTWSAPFYWILLHGWIKIFGISEFALRFPSAVFSFLALILTYLLGKNLFDRKTGLIAAVFIGLSPFHLWYAQEARGYSMVLFLAMVSSLCFLKAMKDNQAGSWLLFTLASCAGLYTNYFFILLFLTQGFYYVFLRRRFNFAAVLLFLFIVIGFVFCLPRFFDRLSYIQGGFWIPQPSWRSIGITFENFLLGYSGTPFLCRAMNVLSFGLLLLSVWRAQKEKMWPPLVFCSAMLLVPITMVFFFSKIFFSVYLDRALIMFSPFFYLILAFGLCRMRGKLFIGVLLMIAAIFSLALFRFFDDKMMEPLEHHVGTYIKRPVRPVVDFLEKNVGKKDTICFTNDSFMPAIGFYGGRPMDNCFLFDPQFPDSNSQRPFVANEQTIPFYKIKNHDFQKLYVLSSNWARDGGFDDNSRSVINWLDRNLKLKLSRNFNGLWVSVYER